MGSKIGSVTESLGKMAWRMWEMGLTCWCLVPSPGRCLDWKRLQERCQWAQDGQIPGFTGLPLIGWVFLLERVLNNCGQLKVARGKVGNLRGLFHFGVPLVLHQDFSGLASSTEKLPVPAQGSSPWHFGFGCIEADVRRRNRPPSGFSVL